MQSISYYGAAIAQRLRLQFSTSRRIVTRPLVRGMPKVELATAEAVDLVGRVPAAKRLIAAYKRAIADEPLAKLVAPRDDLWTRIVEREFSELIAILKSEDEVRLADYLRAFGSKYTWFGGLTLSMDGYNLKKDNRSVALSYLDKLVCLAEACDVLAVENPEQTERWGANLYSDVDDLTDNIEDRLGISLSLQPGLIHTFGIKTNRGPIHYRHINSVFAALRIRELLSKDGAVCEFGGGFGLVSYYAYRLGFGDYTIYDLPIVNVIAGNFLLNALGSDAVSLYGEDIRSDGVKVHPYWACMDAEDKRFRLSLNQDSFPEIDANLVSSYLREIERTTTGYFLSINQEAQASMGKHRQNSVAELIKSRPNFIRRYRMKYWMREGYVEELFSIRH